MAVCLTTENKILTYVFCENASRFGTQGRVASISVSGEHTDSPRQHVLLSALQIRPAKSVYLEIKRSAQNSKPFLAKF